MAERRMFAKTIIDSDAFLDMPVTARLLYYDLGMRADDDGFVNSPKKIMRMIGASDDDMKILCGRKFLIPFDTGVVVIKHWKIHNYIRKDTYNETPYKEEKAMLEYDENNAYRLSSTDSPRIVDASSTQVRLGEVRKGKDSLGKVRVVLGNEKLSEDSYNTLTKKYGISVVDNQIKRILDKPYYGCLNEETLDKWCSEARKPKRNLVNFTQRHKTAEEYDELEKKLLSK